MKREKLLERFSEDELRGLLISKGLSPTTPEADFDLLWAWMPQVSSITRDAHRMDFEHKWHIYIKKPCSCEKMVEAVIKRIYE